MELQKLREKAKKIYKSWDIDTRQRVLESHKRKIKGNSRWSGYDFFKGLTVKEMAYVLELNYKEENEMDKNISKGLRADIEFLKKYLSNGEIYQMHAFRIEDGWGIEFPYISKISLKELEHVLKNYFTDNDKKDKNASKKVEFKKPISKAEQQRIQIKVLNMYIGDETDSLEYEDYTQLINLAESIGDSEWRNEILQREAGWA